MAHYQLVVNHFVEEPDRELGETLRHIAHTHGVGKDAPNMKEAAVYAGRLPGLRHYTLLARRRNKPSDWHALVKDIAYAVIETEGRRQEASVSAQVKAPITSTWQPCCVDLRDYFSQGTIHSYLTLKKDTGIVPTKLWSNSDLIHTGVDYQIAPLPLYDITVRPPTKSHIAGVLLGTRNPTEEQVREYIGLGADTTESELTQEALGKLISVRGQIGATLSPNDQGCTNRILIASAGITIRA